MGTSAWGVLRQLLCCFYGWLRVVVRVPYCYHDCLFFRFGVFFFGFIGDFVLLVRYRRFVFNSLFFGVDAVDVVCLFHPMGRFKGFFDPPRARRFNGEVVGGVSPVAVLCRLTGASHRGLVAGGLVNRRQVLFAYGRDRHFNDRLAPCRFFVFVDGCLSGLVRPFAHDFLRDDVYCFCRGYIPICVVLRDCRLCR